MKAIFADSFYYLALLNPRDESHEEATELSFKLNTPLLTTAWVLTEVADALAGRSQRPNFINLLNTIERDQRTEVLGPQVDLWEEGINLYRKRPDKDWSLTDCISFVVMQEHGLTEALTGDRHFTQAGFKALLK